MEAKKAKHCTLFANVPSLDLKINEPGVFSSKLNRTLVYYEEKYSYELFETCVLPLLNFILCYSIEKLIIVHAYLTTNLSQSAVCNDLNIQGGPINVLQ